MQASFYSSIILFFTLCAVITAKITSIYQSLEERTKCKEQELTKNVDNDLKLIKIEYQELSDKISGVNLQLQMISQNIIELHKEFETQKQDIYSEFVIKFKKTEKKIRKEIYLQKVQDMFYNIEKTIKIDPQIVDFFRIINKKYIK